MSALLSVVKVEYELLPRRGASFMAVIRISSAAPLRRWSLRFVLPGAHIASIIWARWVPDAGGVLVQGTPLPWPRSGADQARIVIFGTGTPRWPTDCVVDGVGCSFTELASAADQRGR